MWAPHGPVNLAHKVNHRTLLIHETSAKPVFELLSFAFSYLEIYLPLPRMQALPGKRLYSVLFTVLIQCLEAYLSPGTIPQI